MLHYLPKSSNENVEPFLLRQSSHGANAPLLALHAIDIRGGDRVSDRSLTAGIRSRAESTR